MVRSERGGGGVGFNVCNLSKLIEMFWCLDVMIHHLRMFIDVRYAKA